jgi:hypothetical protein
MTHPSGESRPSGDNLNFRHCPSCGAARWKTYMHPETGGWNSYCCGAKGYADVGVTKGQITNILERGQRAKEWDEVQLPEWEALSKSARRYLKRRGLDNPGKYGIVELKESTRILIPYRGLMGRIIYWTTRAYMDDGQPKYIACPGRHPLYAVPDVRPHDDVVVVEGVFDAIAVHEATGKAAVALGGKSLPAYLRADLSHLAPNKLTIMLDGDAFADSLKLKQVIPHAKLEILPAGVDPADFYRGEQA